MILIEDQVEILDETVSKKFPLEFKEFEKISKKVIEHPLFEKLNCVDNIRVYSEFQIWCVWDFMSILKVVQNLVFNNTILWTPPQNTELGFNFYQLLMTEETDKSHPSANKNRSSHFETFIQAMTQMNADTNQINLFIDEVRKPSLSLSEILNKLNVNSAIVDFIMTNNELIKSNPLNAISILSLTRENFLPQVFKSVLKHSVRDDSSIELFKWYHERHIQLDEGVHGPIADRLYNEYILSDMDVKKSLEVSVITLTARYNLLNEILKFLK